MTVQELVDRLGLDPVALPLIEMACVIVTEGVVISEEVAQVAMEQEVNLLCTEKSSFDTVARMAEFL